METLITIVHYMVCVFLIIVILLQAGKGADIGAAFGAGGSQTLFGPRGAATFLNKMTAGVAVLFLATSLILVGYSKTNANKSVFEKVPVTESPETAPSETLPSAPLTSPKEKK